MASFVLILSTSSNHASSFIYNFLRFLSLHHIGRRIKGNLFKCVMIKLYIPSVNHFSFVSIKSSTSTSILLIKSLIFIASLH